MWAGRGHHACAGSGAGRGIPAVHRPHHVSRRCTGDVQASGACKSGGVEGFRFAKQLNSGGLGVVRLCTAKHTVSRRFTVLLERPFTAGFSGVSYGADNATATHQDCANFCTTCVHGYFKCPLGTVMESEHMGAPHTGYRACPIKWATGHCGGNHRLVVWDARRLQSVGPPSLRMRLRNLAYMCIGGRAPPTVQGSKCLFFDCLRRFASLSSM